MEELPGGAARRRWIASSRWWIALDRSRARTGLRRHLRPRPPASSLYLTEERHRTPRERGAALLDLRRAYRVDGADVTCDELPDYLPLMLEVAAHVPAARALLAAEREALEDARSALTSARAPSAWSSTAVLSVLPAADTQRGALMNAAYAWQVVAFVILPYVALTVFVVGHIWRYKFDRFGWTSRSSQLYERRLLLVGAPLFHYGALLAILGHATGLLLPKSWTDAAGVPESLYSAFAKAAGTTAAALVVAGLAVAHRAPRRQRPGAERHLGPRLGRDRSAVDHDRARRPGHRRLQRLRPRLRLPGVGVAVDARHLLAAPRRERHRRSAPGSSRSHATVAWLFLRALPVHAGSCTSGAPRCGTSRGRSSSTRRRRGQVVLSPGESRVVADLRRARTGGRRL